MGWWDLRGGIGGKQERAKFISLRGTFYFVAQTKNKLQI